MARIDLPEAIAGLSGKTAFEVWESGNDWSEIIKNAESVLGKQSKWNVLHDETGKAFMVIGKNGKYLNLESAAGAAEEFVTGNQLVTDVVKEESGALTAYTGNILSETGEVTKKGLALGATKGAKFLGGAFAAFGAVMTGVNWYKDNPEFWTDVSQKLLPFAYADPTKKSWGEIFQEAFVPTAIDSDGNTYVQSDFLQTLADELNQFYFFNREGSVVYNGEVPSILKKYDNTAETILKGGATAVNTFTSSQVNTKYPVQNRTQGINVTGANKAAVIKEHRTYAYDESYSTHFAFISDSEFTATLANNDKITKNATAEKIKDFSDNILPSEIKNLLASPEKYVIIDGNYDVDYNLPQLSYTSASDGSLSGNIAPYIKQYEQLGSNPSFTLLYLLLYGEYTGGKDYTNTSLIPDAKYPSGNLADVYPDWYNNALTTVNPNWQPNKPESEDNPKYTTWLPLQFPDTDTPDGDTQPDTTPEDAQSGKPKPDSPVNPDTETAINDGVIPDPTPDPDAESSVNPDPQPQPQPQPTPEPTDPSDPGSIPSPEPTPGVPAIGGGSANALWKIYNPSQAILQSFGRWLWSTDPVKMIKELFSNNPAEGIVGLHMIYVTPPTGGTANIVVGYVDSGVASPWVSQQYVPLDCGSVTIPLRYQSALDFGYTKVYCYLPFIGIVPLDSFDVMGKTVHIRYTVDVLTGTVLAQISVSDGNYSAVLYTFNGSCSVEYPLTSGSRASQLLSLVTGAVGGAVVGGVGGAVLGGARGALTGADVRMSGNLSGNAGAMGIRKPYIIVKRPVEVPARNYNTFYGYPANTTGKLSTFSGYTRVKDVHVENISGATAEEKQEIENLLKSGVIVQ